MIVKEQNKKETEKASVSSSARKAPTSKGHVNLLAMKATAAEEKFNERCSLCSGYHPLQKCPQFQDMTTIKRVSIVQEERRCFACLGLNHRMIECKVKERCSIDRCTGYHSRLLHYTRAPENVPRTNIGNLKMSPTGGIKRFGEVVPGSMTSEHKRPRPSPMRAIMPPPPEPTPGTSRDGSSSQWNRSITGNQVYVTTSKKDSDPYRWERPSPESTQSIEGQYDEQQ